MSTSKTLALKIIVSGAGGVGKTTLLRRFQSGQFIPASTTVGVNFVTQSIDHDGKTIILSIWDYAGEERFKLLFPGYCTGSRGGLAVFDVSRVETLILLSDWINIFTEKNGPNIPIILVGSKTDSITSQQKEFIDQKAKQFAIIHNLRGYFPVSSKNGDNINELFDFLANLIISTLNPN